LQPAVQRDNNEDVWRTMVEGHQDRRSDYF